MTTPIITAYRIPDSEIYYEIRPADADRHWMDFQTGGWANRCLPLRVANQNGWDILNPIAFEVEWKENPSLEAIKIKATGGPTPIQSMFGFGTFTWTIPYLFRTSPGWNLMVRGPANFYKDGAIPLDGIVETDWLPFPFTMSWKVTRALKKVKFDAGDPICTIFPIRRGDVESFAPEIRNLESEPQLLADYNAWLDRRKKAAAFGINGEVAVKQQGQYIRGEKINGQVVADHQTKLNVSPFEAIDQAIVLKPSSPKNLNSELEKKTFWSRLKKG